MSPDQRDRRLKQMRRRNNLATVILWVLAVFAVLGPPTSRVLIREGQRASCRRGVEDRRADIARDHDIAVISRGDHVDLRATVRAKDTESRLVQCDRDYSIVPRIG